ncbi:WSC domain-containing protein [Aspergillus stella-maris]|uniref:WSC domain-containing protein n=1 Tax=Aspergillus stella-maris TaxID=1810926 RepID=UPI003CCCA80C
MKFTPALLTLITLIANAKASDHPATDLGCFSDLDGFENQGSYTFQSQSYCIDLCDDNGKTYAALKGDNCYCGDTDPAKDEMVDDEKCDTACAGYPAVNCGGDNAWTVLGLNMHTPDSWETSSSAVPMSTASETQAQTETATETHSTTSTLINSETSTTSGPTSSTPLSQGASGTPSSTTTSLQYTPTGNSANRAYGFFF